MAVRTLEDPELGRLTSDDGDCWEARVGFQPGLSVAVTIMTHAYGKPQIPIEELCRRAADYLRWSRDVEVGFRQRIADELLDCYNENWVSQAEGQGPVDRDRFLEHVALDSIVLDTDGSACWYYRDGGLFAGHWIEVRVGEDRQFSEAGLAG
jgi:hypothetical protein